MRAVTVRLPAAEARASRIGQRENVIPHRAIRQVSHEASERNGERPPGVPHTENATGVVVHWNRNPRPIIVQQRHEPEGSGRKRRRVG